MHRRVFGWLLALTLVGSLSWLRTQADAAAAHAQSPGPSGVRTVVIDPGHGGDETGVVSATGLTEKDLTLAIATRLQAALAGQPELVAVLTREDDRRLPLRDRTALANTRKASVLISLHLNASAGDTLRGAEFTVMAADEADGVALPSPGTPIPAAGGTTRLIEFVPWDRVALRHREGSLRLAQVLAGTFESAGQLSPRAVQAAPLAVLTGATMPAVVADLGYLTHADDLARLGSPEGQDAVARQLAEAVRQFLIEVPAP
jgi:N-acetylmuramoyl-L-alanine amidase